MIIESGKKLAIVLIDLRNIGVIGAMRLAI